MGYRSTKQVAGILGVKLSLLSRATWEGRVPEPQRGPGGAFLWTDDDIRKASWALLRHGVDLPDEQEAADAK